uniref:Putative lectin/glucanase superfamily protein n=1 Tax=viral metagenome TaxID=1070528 RepID=A0A6M3IX36_9ZZZZ
MNTVLERDFVKTQLGEYGLDPSLRLYLPLYMLDGSSFMSRDAYGHKCSVTGATWGLQGRTFDNMDDVINCGSATVLDNLGTTGNYKFTIVAWINPTSAGEGNSGRVLDKGGLLFLCMNGGAQVEFLIYVGTVIKFADSAANSVPFNSWTHVVGVFNGANALIYTNCTLVTGSATVGPVDNHSASDLRIGDNLGSNRCFGGTIGEVKAYDQIAFTQADVNRDMEATKWRYS